MWKLFSVVLPELKLLTTFHLERISGSSPPRNSPGTQPIQKINKNRALILNLNVALCVGENVTPASKKGGPTELPKSVKHLHLFSLVPSRYTP